MKENLSWNIKSLYENENEYLKDLKKLEENILEFKNKYENTFKKILEKRNSLTNDEINTVLEATKKYNEILIIIDHTYHYASLLFSADMISSSNKKRYGNFNILYSNFSPKISFFESFLLNLNEKDILKLKENTSEFKKYFDNILNNKKHFLGNEIEETLLYFDNILNTSKEVYETGKHLDINFKDFTINDINYPMSFVNFENQYEYEKNKTVRDTAYLSFYNGLNNYKNIFADLYNKNLQKEKQISKLRKFDSVFDYLLFSQEIKKETYNKHIDIIMDKLSIIMRKYMDKKKKKLGLEKLAFSDLLVPMFNEDDIKELPDNSIFKNLSTVSIDNGYNTISEALTIMGNSYKDIAMRFKKEGWVDFEERKGKETGGFCASPYRKNPYILLTWKNLLPDLFTLIHELGHSVHFILSQKNVSFLENEPSLYLVEAPSTLNEIILSNYIIKKCQTKTEKSIALSSLIENTYYHNFVTHFLESYYQREVYKLVDSGENVDAQILSKIMFETYRKFFGEDIDLTGADLTWMRQPHYYNGLYSYTYSAGLSIGTYVGNEISKGNIKMKENYMKFLSLGGSKSPKDLCKILDIDIDSHKALLYTLDYINTIVDNIVI